MGLQFIDKATLPAPTRGKGAASEPSIGITDAGQIRLNAKAVEAFGEVKFGVAIGYDTEAGVVAFINLSKGYPKGKGADNYFKLVMDKGGKVGYISGTAVLLRQYGYDYVASGSQSFSGDNLKFSTSANGTMAVVKVPVGSLTPKPKQTRTTKASKAATAPAPTANTAVDTDSLV